MRSAQRVAIIANGAFSIVNFRGPLIAEMVERGCTVFALAPDFDDQLRAEVFALGAQPLDISLDRFGIRPIRDFIALWQLRGLLKALKLDAVFCYFLKPVLFGTIAAWLGGVKRRYCLIAGLGYLFTDSKDNKSIYFRIVRHFVLMMARFSFAKATRVFFQNNDDLRYFTESRILPSGKSYRLAGTGVDLERFRFHPLPDGPIRFLFVGRLLREKGLREFVAAARMLKVRGSEAVFAIAGEADLNPGGLDEEELAALQADASCDWLGHVADIRLELKNSHVFVLPSYREGMPRSTQEALAMGRPVITTDAIGCRETVVPGLNGWIVPAGDSIRLAGAMEKAMSDDVKLSVMGEESRELAEKKFDVLEINRVTLDKMEIYRVA